MLLRIGSVQKILGVSVETLRFFEKKGIVVPKRNAENNYRYYDGRDVNSIVGYRFFRSMGFTMTECIDLLHNLSSKEAQFKIEARQVQIQENIKQQQLILKRLEFQKELYRRGSTLVGQYLLEELPSYLFYFNQKNRTFEPSEAEKNHTKNWIHAMPQSMVAFHIPREEIQTAGFIHWGHALQLEDSETACALPENLPYTIKCPKQAAVFTVLKSINEDLKTQGRFDPLLEYIETHHMTVAGDVFGTIISNEASSEGFVRYFAAWIPVKSKHKMNTTDQLTLYKLQGL